MDGSPPHERHALHYEPLRERSPRVLTIVGRTLLAIACFAGAGILVVMLAGLISASADRPTSDLRLYLLITLPLFGGSALLLAWRGLKAILSLFVSSVDGP